MKVDDVDLIFVAGYLIGEEAMEECDDDWDQVDSHLIDEYNVSLNDLEKLLGKLVPKITFGVSPLTGNEYKGFAHNGGWLMKVEA